MSNFAQHIFTIPAAQEPIVITLGTGWDKLKSNQRALTRVEFRSILSRTDNPSKVSIKPEDPAYASILAAGEKSKAHIARFDAMAEEAAQSKAGRKLLKTIAELISNS